MNEGKDIILVADYHAENIEFRWFDQASGEERTGRYPTGKAGILRQVEQAVQEVAPGGRVVWIMESTTGWARVKDLVGERTRFLLSNVLQMPLPPKGHRRKTDKIDTARLLREYLCDNLPLSFQPPAWWRQVRRVVDCRQDLVERQTAVKNWISSLLHHETWEDREGLWTLKGRRRLAAMSLPESDRAMLELKVEQLDALAEQQKKVEARMQAIYDAWPEAQWVDEVRGIGMVTAVSVLAHIGPIERFPTAEDLISYAGLAPGTWRSDATCRHGRIGGGRDGRAPAVSADRGLDVVVPDSSVSAGVRAGDGQAGQEDRADRGGQDAAAEPVQDAAGPGPVPPGGPGRAANEGRRQRNNGRNSGLFKMKRCRGVPGVAGDGQAGGRSRTTGRTR